MPYIRTMPDGSKKKYYTSEEMQNKTNSMIHKHAEILKEELNIIRQDREQRHHLEQTKEYVYV